MATMTEELTPADRVTITLNDMEWELVPTDKLTFPETRELKRITAQLAGGPGMSLVEVEQGIKLADADAWFAWIYVSVKRSWPQLTVQDIEKAIGDTPVVEIIQSVKDNTPEGMEPFGAAPASKSESHETSESDDSGAKTPPLSTLVTPGKPPTEIQE